MMDDLRRLSTWLRRAQPPKAALARAIGAGLVASVLNVALLVGAVALLVESATRPGLNAVLGVLIVIELFAFARSPLRYGERLSAHRLGYAAVTHWRRWLVSSVGRFDYTKWRTYAAGDLLERSLRDTEELQDLWLRCVIPLVTTVATMVIADIVVGVLAPRGQWWSHALALLVIQSAGIAGIVVNVGPLLGRDRALRRARGHYRGELVELSAMTPDLVLLGRSQFAWARQSTSVERLRRAEAALVRRRRLTESIAPITGAVALSTIVWHPAAAPVWIVTAAMLAMSSLEFASAVRLALDTAINVVAGAERLDELDAPALAGSAPWPEGTTLRIDDVRIVEGVNVLVRDQTLAVEPGRRVAITGPSGAGKSSLLRALAGLERVDTGLVVIGGVAIADLDEAALRSHLAYVPSEPGLTRGFARDVIAMGRATTRDPFDDLARLGIEAAGSTRWDQLSRGERQRVAIVRSLVPRPSIILLDEPTSGLGVDETASLLDLVAGTGATVVVATHDAQVIDWCDEAFELRDGTLRALSR